MIDIQQIIVKTKKKDNVTYKCFVLCSISRPGVVPLDIGMGPLSWFSAKSSQ